MTARTGTARRDFFSKILAQKYQELATIESQLAGTLSGVDGLKLNNQADNVLVEIEKLEKQLLELDAKDENSNVRHLKLEESFQKIDFSEAKKIAQSLNTKFGDDSGAILLFLQKSTQHKGNYCINEVVDLIVSDRKVGDDIIGDFRPYAIDLGSPISEFNEGEFSKRLASHLSDNSELLLRNSIKTLCSSLRGGSIVFIRIENWDSIIEQKTFLDWFMKEFWEVLICEIDPIFREYSKIRFLVALIAKSPVFTKRSSYPVFFCKKNKFDHRKIIELPLPKWSVEDIKKWLIISQKLSNAESLQLAEQIYRESGGKPDTICFILEQKFKVC
ncbi:hypothetical protein [Mastigocladopsis repens]|uniref:hypothetical protein n=1 Tax=Mastigocladopsis repens TaxID=221287 RepID=UPI00031A276B|nr:hypothetical protein [Mastigocladopsis repens]